MVAPAEPAPRIDELLRPIGLDRFRTQWFGKKSLHVEANERKARAIASLFDFPALKGALTGDLSGPLWRSAPELLASFTTADGVEDTLRGISVQMVAPLIRAGMTIVANGIDRTDAQLGALVDDFARELAHPGPIQINGYYSPDHGGAFGWHWDDHDVFILQVEGAKHWRLGPEPSYRNPPIHVNERLLNQPGFDAACRSLLGTTVRFPPDEFFVDYVLRPGDVLYVPAGTWHRAFARTSSLALTVALSGFGFSQVLHTVLALLTLRNPAWFETLGDWPSARGEVPSEDLMRALAERLAEARQELNGLTPERLLEAYGEVAPLVDQLPGLPFMISLAGRCGFPGLASLSRKTRS